MIRLALTELPREESLKCMNKFLIGCYRQPDWYLNSTTFFYEKGYTYLWAIAWEVDLNRIHTWNWEKKLMAFNQIPQPQNWHMLQTHSVIQCFDASHKSSQISLFSNHQLKQNYFPKTLKFHNSCSAGKQISSSITKWTWLEDKLP